MPNANAAALAFLQSRRSVPAKTLTTPVPDRAALHDLLTIAARSPDHGKLEPWRFIVLGKPALARLATLALARAQTLGLDDEKAAKAQGQFATADLVVAVISAPKASEKVPHIEQIYSAGAVCLALVNAALAAGWGANWLSGWASHDATFCRDGLGLRAGESVAGLIHIGTATATPPDRPRPDLSQITTWLLD